MICFLLSSDVISAVWCHQCEVGARWVDTVVHAAQKPKVLCNAHAHRSAQTTGRRHTATHHGHLRQHVSTWTWQHIAVSHTANLCTKILDFRGFDSSRIFILRGGIHMPLREFLGMIESSKIGRDNISRERFGVVRPWDFGVRARASTHIYIYIYTHTYAHTYIYIYIYTWYIHMWPEGTRTPWRTWRSAWSWTPPRRKILGRPGHGCHILPFQQILWNEYLPSEPANTAKRSPKSISEGGRIWQVWLGRPGIGAGANVGRVTNNTFDKQFSFSLSCVLRVHYFCKKWWFVSLLLCPHLFCPYHSWSKIRTGISLRRAAKHEPSEWPLNQMTLCYLSRMLSTIQQFQLPAYAALGAHVIYPRRTSTPPNPINVFTFTDGIGTPDPNTITLVNWCF